MRSLTPMRKLLAGVCLLAGYSVSQAAVNPDDGDIRNIKVGVPLTSISQAGYVMFACVSNGLEAGLAIDSWDEFTRCPVNGDGLHEVTFQYDDDAQEWAKFNDKWAGTKIAGHPVLLSILINGEGQVIGLRAITDPAAKSYLRKKAYLLSYKIKSRYKDGSAWQCDRKKPGSEQEKVGGYFIDELCEKDYQGRRIIVKTQLFREPGQSIEEFVNSTRMEVLAKDS